MKHRNYENNKNKCTKQVKIRQSKSNKPVDRSWSQAV